MPVEARPADGDGTANVGGDDASSLHRPTAPLATRLRSGRVTRREAIGVLAVAAATPLAARVTTAASGDATTLVHTPGRVELRRGGRAWVLDVRHYEGRPRLDVVREGAAATVRLTGALFPGTAFPADLCADVHPSGDDLRLRVTRADGFDATVLAGEWLAGTAVLSAPVRPSGDVSGADATVRIALAGAADARYGPDGVWTLAGRRLVRLNAPDAHVTADGLRISRLASGPSDAPALPSDASPPRSIDAAPGEASLFARPAVRRTALDLTGLRETAAPLSVGDGGRWRLDVDAVAGGPLGSVRVETARTRRGVLREAMRLDVRDDARPRAVPAPGFRPHGDGDRAALSDADFAIALERLRIAAIYGPDAAASGTSGSVERAAAADFAPASWLHDAAMTVGLGSGVGSEFRLRSLGLRLVEAVCRPVLLAAAVLPGGAGTIARPLGDGRGTLVDVVSSRRRPSAKRLPSHLHLDARRGASLAFEDQLVAMLRPTDLAIFTFALRNLTVQTRGGTPMLVAGNGAMLGVVLPAQTFGEQAFYRTATLPGGGAGEANPGGETPDAPIKARMAGLSRLVFDVPSGQTIPYTLDGLLEAMRRLSLRVAPNATDASPMQASTLLAGQLSAKPAGQFFAAQGPGGLAAVQLSPAQLRDMSSGTTPPVLTGLALPSTLRQTALPEPGARRTDLTTRLLSRSGARVNPQTRAAEATQVQTVAPEFSPRGTGGRVRSATERSLAATLAGRRDVRLLTQTEYGSSIGALADILTLAPPPEPPGKPRAPRVDETALEVPFRLLVSPSQRGAWIHRSTPGASAATSAVELWHTRLGVRTAAGALGRADRDAQRVLTALWYTDPEIPETQKSQIGSVPPHANVPFRMPLDAYDRHNLVHLTSNHDGGNTGGGNPGDIMVLAPGPGKPFKPAPARVRSLMLSSLGAWIDARGSWEARPAALSVSEWVHRGTMGRDHYVKVVYEGALFPTGHRAAVIKVTERAFTPGGMAVLFQRMYLVVRERVRTYGSTSAPALDRAQPLRSATLLTLQTPDLDDPAISDINSKQQGLFWPRVGGKDVLFSVRFEDVEGETHDVAMPLAFADTKELGDFGAQVQRLLAGQSVSATPLGNLVNAYFVGAPAATGDTSAPYNDRATVAFPQSLVTFAAPDTSGDTTFETAAIRLGALPVEAYPYFVPFALGALVNIPSLQQITGNGAAVVTWNASFLRDGFPADGAPPPSIPPNDPPFNRGHVLFDLATPLVADVPAEKSGGFVRPAVSVTAVTRRSGPVGGDVKKVAADTFDPASFFGGLGDAMPKLFGVFKLTDILKAVGMDMSKAPRFLTETMQTVERLLRMGTEFATFADSLAGAAPASPEAALRSAIQAARTTAEGIVAQIKAKIDDLAAQVQSAANSADDAAQEALEGATTAWANGLTGSLGTLATQLTAAITALGTLPVTLPGGLRLEADRRMRQLLGFVEKADRVADLVNQIARFVRIAQAAAEMRVRLEWQPDLADFSLGSWKVFEAKNARGPASLTLAAEFAAQQGSGGPAYDLTCSLDRFTVNLPGPVASLDFDRLFFRACSGRKVEVDAVFGGITFKGPLSFVERLRSIIPLDGFSDPPYLDVSASGIVAGFTLAIPDLAVGMFAMRNMSFGAELNVPFLGDLTLGLRFCERENPCSVTVMCLGGGFYFGILLGMNGLRTLEAAIEVQASLSINLGIASGSVYAALGVFFSMEMVGGERHITLMGYFRIGGSVRILGFISVSIELRLEMIYKDPPKKMIGRATLEVEVEVFCFSKTFRLEYERKLAGSNDDPTLRHMLATPYKEPVTGATVLGWDEYLVAFA